MKLLIIMLSLGLISGCVPSSKTTKNKMENAATSNRLINASSPYLLQHAYNPVDWYPWGEEALLKAKNEDKPILVSIGYSSCHWCHVMAHESFENDSIAALMNANFVNIKIDREERPDIDQIYMEAVQAMGINGGWPLNVFLTPDQKPFYGGTYFPSQGWRELLMNVKTVFAENRSKLEESAEVYTKAINANVSEKYQLSPTAITQEKIDSGYQKLAQSFDSQWGGLKKAPKFIMPSQWSFLIDLAYLNPTLNIQPHLEFTLNKIIDGGIYDQIGGGFSRYSVDEFWHVPHFEKMLYDNGQLLSLYAKAYKMSSNERYASVIDETIQWLIREMLDDSGGFYAALDADSEGEEGKFYVWTYDEMKEVAGEHTALIAAYYDIQEKGNWESTNVPRMLHSEDDIATQFGLELVTLQSIITQFKQRALLKRAERIRPGLDNKIISGWNGLTLTGILEAYQATGKTTYLTLAKRNYDFILKNLLKDGTLIHVANLSTQGFAEDYAAIIQALIKYYETTFDEEALRVADDLTLQMNEQYYDPQEKLFYFTSIHAENLIARKNDLFDNVIPSSNSMMAENLLKLGLHLDNEPYKKQALDMVNQVGEMMAQETSYLSQWASVATLLVKPIPEIVIFGDDYQEVTTALNALHIPRKVVAASAIESDLPLLQYKTEINGKTAIYVCYNKTCKLPVTDLDVALTQISSE